MKEYERVTQKQGEPIIVSKRVYYQLRELEDKIENGTLVELPCKVGDNAVAIIDKLCYPNAIYNVKLKDLAYIVEDENGDVTFQQITRIFGTKAEAEAKLKELDNSYKENR